MALSLRHRPSAPQTGDHPGAEPPATGAARVVPAVHRIGAVVVALVIATFGVLGLLDGLAYFSTDGERILGLSSNGLLSTISLVTAAVLVAAALHSHRTASTVMIAVGTLFLVSALANLAVLETDWNFLAFSMANVIFSICAGLVLLTLGAYGRVSGNLPADSPYRADRPDTDEDDDTDQGLPTTPAEVAAERAMRDAELAVVEHRATPEQQRRVAAMAQVRTRADRRRVWMEMDGRALR
ncbi:DUF4383 domain-containing protein [Modestobacter roseus]|uniref:Uncharacterized protein DUF4383 n=1 Tax=Modestobacter roseus TaxID=1181884 RepID=A0A562IXD9_9ACTN|nr:DUF4383 domain-containing protein [Modestobacter roseus]MQA34818.1 DUF4383 domain-containing protein [Modestobacter roseus]TWH75552.1 uncharacterized protein DUF4383 [Modestobacter roseus]